MLVHTYASNSLTNLGLVEKNMDLPCIILAVPETEMLKVALENL